MDQEPNSPPPKKHDDLDDVQEQMRSQDDLDRKERIAYLKRMAGPRKSKKSWWKWLVAGVILAGLAGAAVYFFVLKSDGADKKKAAPTDSAQTNAPSGSEPQQNATITTKHHQSPTFGLEFDYPDDWTVTDDASGKLTVKSPSMQLKGASGKTVTGQIVFTIQSKQDKLKEFDGGNGLAVRESEKLTYTKPTASQRAQTYLSFVSYAGSATTGIEGLYITGDIGYQKDQAVPMVDIVRVDPLINFGFTGNGAASLSLSADNWNDANLFTKSVKTILTSLSIQ